MITDCVMYHNDKLTFQMRYELLKDCVDKFVVLEATKTHAGKDKDLQFVKDFPEALPKVQYCVIGLPHSDDRWFLENQHRLGLTQVIQPEGWYIISDCDEIPDMSTWHGQEGVFVQRHSYYTPYLVDPRPWNGSVILGGWRFHSPYGKMNTQDARNFRDLLRPVGTGWHFGWLGNQEWGQQKIDDFAHSELKNTDFASAYHNARHPGDNVQLVENYNVPEVVRRIYDSRGI